MEVKFGIAPLSQCEPCVSKSDVYVSEIFHQFYIDWLGFKPNTALTASRASD